jgi:transcriptional regulator with XRE-family HTH domain
MNERLRSAIRSNGYTEDLLAEESGVDPKTVQRWITQSRVPHRNTARRVASLLNVRVDWLWPSLAEDQHVGLPGEMVAFYPHRSHTPKALWLELILSANRNIDLFANASLFLPEDNPDAIATLAKKAQDGARVRILIGDPDSEAMALRGREERLFGAIPSRIRMALAYYRPLIHAPGVEFRLHSTSLYNSIFRFDDQMLINQHIYGTYGYIAPILHLRRREGHDLFDTYLRSFELVWNEESAPLKQDE